SVTERHMHHCVTHAVQSGEGNDAIEDLLEVINHFSKELCVKKGGKKMSKTKDITVGITGMTCAACSSRIERVLKKIDGVEAQVNLTTEKANIHYDPDVMSFDDISEKIEHLGFGVQSEKLEFDVLGMTCAACSNRVEKVLNK